MKATKLLLLDVDGVMTDGTKMYGPDGSVFGKRFCDHDQVPSNIQHGDQNL